MMMETARQRIERCEAAVTASPDSAAAHFNLGLAYGSMGRPQSAAKEYSRAVELDPDLAEAWVNLGGARLLMWDFEGCLEAARQAVERQPSSPVAHFNMGQAYLYLGNAEQLVDCNRRVVELEPRNGAAHYYLAVGLLATHELDEARKELNLALRLGHRPTPEFLRALERAEAQGDACDGVATLEVGG
jgi:tetratricopeptide (TPR) repeat protein